MRIDTIKKYGYGTIGLAGLIGLIVAMVIMNGCQAGAKHRGARVTAETTQDPAGVVHRRVEAEAASDEVKGDKGTINGSATAPTASINPDGSIVAGGGAAKQTLTAEVAIGGYSIFYWCSLFCVVGMVIAGYLGHLRVGGHLFLAAIVFALCGWSQWFVVLLVVQFIFSLSHLGLNFEGLRAVVSAAKEKGVWETVRSNLSNHAEFGDHFAVKAAERAET